MSPIQISIKDYKAVKSAEIDLNGITVIAGINGAGKSSISRLLYYALKYANNFDIIVNKLFESELMPIDMLLQTSTVGFGKSELISKIRSYQRMASNSSDNETKKIAYTKGLQLIKELLLQSDSRKDSMLTRITSIIEDSILKDKKEKQRDKSDAIEAVIKEVEGLFEKAQSISSSRNYSLLRSSIIDAINDDIKNVSIFEYGVPFVGKEVKNVPILNYIKQVAYIDTPMIVGMDLLNNRFQSIEYWEDLNTLLKRPAKKKYSHTINKYIKTLLNGGTYYDDVSYGIMKYRRDDGLLIDLLDSATGIKSLSLLQTLLRNGAISEHSLLIIDEPEAHLHPQWIVEYARIIVMMHQKIGAKFFIASHSTDFVSAIKYIAEKQKVQKSLSFYLAEEDKRKPYSYNYKSIGTDIEPIFESFNKSLDKISEYGGW